MNPIRNPGPRWFIDSSNPKTKHPIRTKITEILTKLESDGFFWSHPIVFISITLLFSQPWALRISGPPRSRRPGLEPLAAGVGKPSWFPWGEKNNLGSMGSSHQKWPSFLTFFRNGIEKSYENMVDTTGLMAILAWWEEKSCRMVLRKNKLWSGPKMVLLVTTRQSLGLHQNMGRACSVSGCFGSPVIQGVPSVGATVPEDWLDASPIHMEVRQFPRNLGGQEARLVRMMITTLWRVWMEMVTCSRGKKWTSEF